MSLLSIAPASVMLNERGGPVPSPSILAALRRVDPALGLRFIANFEHSAWAVTWEWPERDRRWARVRSQEIPRESAYDILGYLPVECSLDQARTFVEAHLKNSTTEDISKLRGRINRWNDVEIPAQQVSALVADTLDDIAREQRAPKGLKVFHG